LRLTRFRTNLSQPITQDITMNRLRAARLICALAVGVSVAHVRGTVPSISSQQALFLLNRRSRRRRTPAGKYGPRSSVVPYRSRTARHLRSRGVSTNYNCAAVEPAALGPGAVGDPAEDRHHREARVEVRRRGNRAVATEPKSQSEGVAQQSPRVEGDRPPASSSPSMHPRPSGAVPSPPTDHRAEHFVRRPGAAGTLSAPCDLPDSSRRSKSYDLASGHRSCGPPAFGTAGQLV
jgi:hypothetical protein